MAAIYWVNFKHKTSQQVVLISVSSADAKSMKRADIRAAYRKAYDKAKDKLKTAIARGREVGSIRDWFCIENRCVG